MGKHVATRRVIVGTEAVELVGANEKRKCVWIYNLSASTIYITGSKATPTVEGYPVLTATSHKDNYSTGALYAIADVDYVDVRVKVVGE